MIKTDKWQDLLRSVSGITDDSRKVKKGYLFVAVKGIKKDGHDFIKEAIQNGVTAVVGEKGGRPSEIPGEVKYLRVKDSRKALGEIASNWFGNPSGKLKVIGVTGTDGKTTTASLIYHILKSLGKKVGLVSTVAAIIGGRQYDTGFHVTNPDAIALQEFLALMVKEKCEYAVIEVTSHGIDQERIAGIDFKVDALTNITHEHLDYHKTFEEYQKTKLKFLKMAKTVVLNRDDASFDYLKDKLKGRRVIVYGKDQNLKGILPGEYNEANAACAIAACTVYGIDRKKAIEAIQSFELPEGRLEKVKTGKDFDAYIDFAHTPNALENVLAYLRTKTKGKLIAVFGSAGERDRTKRPLMGKAASLYADVIILTAEDPRTETVESINTQIRSGVAKNIETDEIKDRQEAINFAVKIAKKRDLIGIFGKGHEKSMNLDGKTEIPWSDRKAVEKALKYTERSK